MNEPKSSRYHRLVRRAGVVSLAVTAGLLLVLVWIRPSLPVIAYAAILTALHELITFPISYYRGVLLERRYELSSEPFAAWFRDHLKGLALALVFATGSAWGVYRLMAFSPRWWWILAAIAGVLVTLLLVSRTAANSIANSARPSLARLDATEAVGPWRCVSRSSVWPSI